MYAADKAAMAAGVPGVDLMAAAGRAVADAVSLERAGGGVVVLCGPGNNGGDGFVAARVLAGRGWSVRVALLGDRARLKGDAAHHAALWDGPVEPLAPGAVVGATVVIDAVFGAGLTRDVDGVVAETLDAIPGDAFVVAVDVPSGVCGDTGTVRGTARRADRTVTFFRAKPGHWLYRSRGLVGALTVADIGIPEAVLGAIAPQCLLAGPRTFADDWPHPSATGHKYDRGHVLAIAGPEMSGAARLVAHGAQATGAGLVTVAAPPAAVPVIQAGAASLIVLPLGMGGDIDDVLADPRRNAIVIGPGLGQSAAAADRVLACLSTGRTVVADADALSCFAGRAAEFAEAVQGPCIVTPHDGEFARLFPDLEGSRLEKARAAARALGAVVLLKGADTVVADPEGRAVINRGAPPWLATAGAGDVLAGTVAGFAAQGMPAFRAAAMAAWVHGRAAAGLPPTMSADDLAGAIGPVVAGRGTNPHRGCAASLTRIRQFL